MKQADWHSENIGRVKDVLFQVEARHLSQIDGPSKGKLDFYSVNGKVLIVQEYGQQSGFEVFVPIECETNRVSDCIKAIQRYAGTLIRCPDCLDVPGKNGLGQVCQRCQGQGEIDKLAVSR